MQDLNTRNKFISFNQITFALLALAFSAYSFSEVSITMKGQWQVKCAGLLVSNHNRYDKALQSAINQTTDCDIMPPSRFEVRGLAVEVVPVDDMNISISFTWSIPTGRTDGSILALDDIEGYVIRWEGGESIIHGANVVEKVITLPDGNYSFTISTIAKDGTESAPSASIII
jgi:hypothetical protein